MNGIDFNMDILTKAMTLRLQRHAALAGNIANADTPGYRPTQVSFEEQLQKAAQSKNEGLLTRISPKLETIDDGPARLDGNTVNLDKQMGDLEDNSVVYNATADFLARRLKMIKSVIV